MKIGDYVKTKNGLIGQIIKCNSIYFILDIDKDNIAHEQDEIYKSSDKIINLIEIGDYVNGREVREVYDLGFEKCFCFKNEYGRHYDKTYKIKTIVTKEQFESMKYKVVE